MDALISFRANGVGNFSPTPIQRQKSSEEISSLFRKQLESLQRSLQQTAAAAEDASVEKSTQSAIAKAAKADTNSDEEDDDNTSKDVLGKDTFLELLVTQMQYQDPLSPMDNSQMIAQLAQFSSLEQVNNISTQITEGFEALNSRVDTMNLLSAQGLVGKEVTGLNSDGDSVSGAVTGVLLTDGVVGLRLNGGESIALSSVTAINNAKEKNNAS